MIATYGSGCLNATAGAGVTSWSCPTSGTISVTAGQTGLVFLTYYAGTAFTATCADSLGNTWATVPLASGSYPTVFATGNGFDYVFYSHIVNAGSDLITCTFSNAVNFPSLSAVILDGASVSPIQTASSVENPSVTGGTPYAGANVTTTLAGGLVVCFSTFAGASTLSAGTSPQVMTVAAAATTSNVLAEYGNFVSTGTNHCEVVSSASGDVVIDTIAIH